jgi:hypothetical protein
MLELQRMIDLGLLDPDEPIDLTAICNTKRKHIKPLERHYGFNLTDEVNKYPGLCESLVCFLA